MSPLLTMVVGRLTPDRGRVRVGTSFKVEFATFEWVDWFSTRRLLEPIRYVPPAEYETAYHQQAEAMERAFGRDAHDRFERLADAIEERTQALATQV
jgi:hypothetical protein